MSRLCYSTQSTREAGSCKEEIECKTRLGSQGSTGNSEKVQVRVLLKVRNPDPGPISEGANHIPKI
jgi:hypothetical protein